MLSPIERAASVLGKYNTETDIPASFLNDLQETTVDYLNVFTPLHESEHLEGLIIADDLNKFKRPILDRSVARDQVEYIQRLCGKTSQQAMNIAIEVIGDMEKGTKYPPDVKPTTTGDEISGVIHNLIDAISLKKKEAAEKDSPK